MTPSRIRPRQSGMVCSQPDDNWCGGHSPHSHTICASGTKMDESRQYLPTYLVRTLLPTWAVRSRCRTWCFNLLVNHVVALNSLLSDSATLRVWDTATSCSLAWPRLTSMSTTSIEDWQPGIGLMNRTTSPCPNGLFMYVKASAFLFPRMIHIPRAILCPLPVHSHKPPQSSQPDPVPHKDSGPYHFLPLHYSLLLPNQTFTSYPDFANNRP